MGGELSCELVRQKLAELGDCCSRLGSGDEAVETVHRGRTAIRRLRTALELFGHLLDSEAVSALRQQSKALAKKLGAVRDADVFLRHLSRQRPRGDTARAVALRFARNRVRLVREEDVLSMRDAAARFLASLDEFSSALRPILRGVEAPGTGGVPVGALAAMRDRLDEMRSFEDAVCGERDVERSHRMRIAAKHLRYALEMCGQAVPSTRRRRVWTAGLSAVVHVHGALGHVHDHHVWRQRLKEMRREMDRTLGDPQLTEGLRSLARAEAGRRDRRLGRFVQWWRKLCSRGVPEALRAALLPDT